MDQETLDRLKQRLAALPLEQRQWLASSLDREREPIAVVGIACRLPGRVRDARSYWQLLDGGDDAVMEVPRDRWDVSRLYDPDPDRPGTMVSRWGGFLEDVRRFDARFFRISPREAQAMDPQQRLLLEVAWEACEDAGFDGARRDSTPTGVFVGLSPPDYYREPLAPHEIDAYVGPGSQPSVAAGRISYFLGLTGPCLAVDTACSSSLVAVHLACESLQRDECAAALAGGVNLVLSPLGAIGLSRMGALAPDGRCKAFDVRADGYVRSEGCGLVVLKRLDVARKDGDRIYAVIEGSAINHDGRSAGLTAPSAKAQERVIRAALARAGVDPRQVGFVEAHGTGTPLGDPIEIEALAGTYGVCGRPGGGPCFVGSVKSQLGHLEAAAGITGLIKAILALRADRIPGNLHLERASAKLPLDGTRLRLLARPEAWPAGDEARFAAVSSFGWSGTNAHAVLSDRGATPRRRAERREPIDAAGALRLVALSAPDPDALRSAASHLRERILAEPERFDLDSLAHTTVRRRTLLESRLVIAVETLAEALDRLECHEDGVSHPDLATGNASRRGRLAFVLSGYGSQWPGMGLDLLRSGAAFSDSLERSDALFREIANLSVLAELHAPETDSRLWQVEVGQPCVFAVQLALVSLLGSHGIEPDALVGHSLGEVTVAVASGALSHAEGARIVAERSRLLSSRREAGGMLVAEMRPEELDALEPKAWGLSLAAHNGPSALIVAGPSDGLRELAELLRERGRFAMPMNVSVAGHSPEVDPILPELIGRIGPLEPRKVDVDLYSPCLRTKLDGGDMGPEYWAGNLRLPVLLWDTVRRMHGDGVRHFLEVGPSPVLASVLREGFRQEALDARVTTCLSKGGDARREMARAVAAVLAQGHRCDPRAFLPERGEIVALPPFDWSGEPHWRDPSGASVAGREGGETRGVSELGARWESPSEPGRSHWDRTLDAELESFAGHRLDGEIVVPAAAYVAWCRRVAEALDLEGWHDGVLVEQMELVRPLVLGPEDRRRLHVLASEEAGGGGACIEFHSRSAGDAARGSWTLHARARIRTRSDDAPVGADDGPAETPYGAEIPAAELYERFAAVGMHYSGPFRRLAGVQAAGGEAIVTLSEAHGVGIGAEAAAVDGALQGIAAAAIAGGVPSDRAFVPHRCEHLWLRAKAPAIARARARIHSVDSTPAGPEIVAAVRAWDGEGVAVLDVRGLRLRALGSPSERFVDGLLLRSEWDPYAPTEPAGTALDPMLVVLGEGVETARRVRSQLGAAGAAVLVAAGVPATRLVAGESPFDASQPDSPARLLERIGLAKARHVIVSLGARAPDSGPGEAGGAALWAAALCAIRAHVSVDASGPPRRVVLVTRGALPVAGSDRSPDAAAAALWGLGRTLAIEEPEISCTRIDLDPTDCDLEGLAAVLADPRLAREEIALRGGGCLVHRLRPFPSCESAPGAAATEDAREPRFRADPEGSYLVLGGGGELGRVVADWLVERGARHLVLLGRRAPEGALADALASLRGRAEQVVYLRADVTEPDAVQAAWRAAALELPTLRGVFHLAGALEDASLHDQTPAHFALAARPKLGALRSVEALCRVESLDFLVAFSSIAGVLGSPGQANYAGANAALDSRMAALRARGVAATSIAWGPWAETGRARASSRRGEALRRFGVPSLATDVALRVLDRILHELPARVAVLDAGSVTTGLARRALEEQPLLSDLGLGRADEPRAGEFAHALREAQSPEARRRLLTDSIGAILGELLGCPGSAVELDRPLGELGFDSMMAIQLRQRLERLLGCRVPTTLFFSHPTVSALIPALADRAGFAIRGEPEPPARAVPAGPLELVLQGDDLAAALEARLDALEAREPRRTLEKNGST